jgi:succinyl-CoA synthetase alpha subunit
MCTIHGLGGGVRHAIGTGSRDVSAEIGGITMLQALDMFAEDASTHIIAIVSKPPAPEVARKVLDRVCRIGKSCAVLFLGDDASQSQLPPNIIRVDTLYDAAVAAVALANGHPFAGPVHAEQWRLAPGNDARRFAPGQHLMRALYSGGTFCTEAQVLWRRLGFDVHSNSPLGSRGLQDTGIRSGQHLALDMGGDEFTVGRPHPMIGPQARIARLLEEARDPATAVIVLDIVLGHGAHPNPADALAPAIAQAKTESSRAGRHLVIVTFACGTEEDPQRLSTQQSALREAGAHVAPNSTAAAMFAGEIAVCAKIAAAKRPAGSR